MLSIAIILSILIAALIAGQLAGVAAYLHASSRVCYPPVAEDALPQAAILLALRGSDPHLHHCLQRLATQDYPHYSLHVILDHVTDPASQSIASWREEHPDFPLEVHYLQDISQHAYLKTSAMRQCIAGLDAQIGAVLLVDGDTLVYDGWLRDSVTPMIDSDIGVTTANRWYDPTRCSAGALVRCIYNACCVGPMFFMRTIWGGSLGIRRDVFAQDYLLERMRRAPTEEQAIQAAAQHAGATVEVLPQIMILNREDCSLASCFAFIRRQLIWTRLQNPNWNRLVAGVLLVYLLLAVAFVLAPVAAIAGHRLAAALLGSALLTQIAMAQFMLEWLHSAISRRMLAAGAEPFPAITPLARLRLLLIWPLGFLFFCWALIAATLSRQVTWRGIIYDIVPPSGIRLREYHPFTDQRPTSGPGNTSIG